jgi:protein phosphatase
VAEVSAQQSHDDVLDMADISGKRRVETQLMGTVVVPEENAAAALEVLSRFAADPRWVIYLPPTMSPSETSQQPETLEHPAEAFAYFHNQGVAEVLCEQKHMGSRAVIIVCRDAQAARRRFGVEGSSGIIYTRTGRRFFGDPTWEEAVMERVRRAADTAGLFDEWHSDWLLIDAEIMPWSLKAHDLVKRQYAAVGRAGQMGLTAALDVLAKAAARGLPVSDLSTRTLARKERIDQYMAAYRRYVWPVESAADVKIAPFHLLASEGSVHTDRDHLWHLEQVNKLAAADPELMHPTPFLRVRVGEPTSVADGVAWWEALTAAGHEGMVVKPLSFIARNERGRLVQPALKVRGREYLRIIYGPDYTAPENLTRLRHRGLAAKRSLALREFALGIEGLTRFVAQEPLRRVHECAHAVLALESQPIDPRL